MIFSYDKPRLFTSLISGQMEPFIEMRIVLFGQLQERVLLWCVFISPAADKEATSLSSLHHF